jgi:hypothetical protein
MRFQASPSPPSRPPRLHLVALLVAVSLLLTVSKSAAMSCAPSPYEERYFLSCANSACQAAFHVTTTEGFGHCSRRPVVEDVDPQVAAYLASLLAASGGTAPDGIYELRFPGRYWWRRSGTAWEDFKENLDSALRYEQRLHCVGPAKPDEVVQLMNKQHPGWLLRRPDLTAASLRTEREALERDATLQHVLTVLAWFANWASALLALLALVHSVHLYFSRLYAQPGPPPLRRLAAPLVIQGLICLAGVAGIPLALGFVWPAIVLLPAIVVLLLAEGWARFRRKRTAAA